MNKIEKSKAFKDYLDEYTAKETIRQHKIALNKYFEYYNKNPDTYIKDIRNLGNGTRNKITDQYEHDITKYRNYLTTEGYSPKSIHNYVSSVKMLLEHHRIDLDKTFWKKLKGRGIEKVLEPICDFKIPTQKELKKILTHANTKPRAMYLLQSSSGMRIGEVCNLKYVKDDPEHSDIDLSYEYPHITLRDTKNRAKGRTRCSPEAKEAILEWLKIRPNNNDNRLFQCKSKVARIMWNRMLKNSGLAKKDKHGKYPRNLMGTHSLRKYFRNEFSKYNNDIASYLMNQRTGLDRKYRDWTDEYLDQEYSKGVDHLFVFQSNVTDEKLTSINEELDQLRKDNEEMKAQILELRLDKLEKKNRIK